MSRARGGSPGDLGSWVAAEYGERDEQALNDLLAFGGMAANLVARGKAAYDDDVQLQLAGEAIMSRVGEAVSRLSDRLVAECPDIRFRAMRRARNLVAHNYGIVDPQIVWSTLAQSLPEDIRRIQSLLKREA